METSTSGRVLPIRGGNMMSPAVCLICRRPGSDVDEQFADPSELYADPHIMEEFFGSVYFCRNCSLEIAAVFGAQSNEEIQALKDENTELKTRVEFLSSSNMELGNALDNLTLAYSRLRGLNATGDGSVANDSGATPEQESQPAPTDITDSGTDESSESTESSTVSGPDDVNESPSDDVDDFLRNL